MILAPRVLSDVEDIHAHLTDESPVAAERWLERLLQEIDGLGRFPRRCAPAPEDRLLPIGLRHSLLGNYRILFTIDERAGVVHVLHVRHGARESLDRTDLEVD